MESWPVGIASQQKSRDGILTEIIKIGSIHFLNYCQMQFVERMLNIWPTKISAYMVYTLICLQ